jgi:hypothetical protein
MTATSPTARLPALALYGIAMGVLEAAVVVYLRELYYPEGFRFPLVDLPRAVLSVELVREACTLVMLGTVAFLAGRDRLDRFFVFAFLFGTWDLAYYAGLWAFLGWPESLWTWDVLFLIPVIWASPVFYPALIAVALVVGFVVHDVLRRRGEALVPTTGEWIVSGIGALVLIVSFCWDWREVWAGRTPERFVWWIYAPGFLLAVVPFVRAALRAVRGGRAR